MTESKLAHDLKAEIDKKLEQARGLREEVRLKLHLASMDAKTEWEKLEPTLTELEGKAHELTEATHNAVTEALKRLSALRASMS